MKINLSELREIIRKVLFESDFRVPGRAGIEAEENAAKSEKHIKSNSSYGEFMANREGAMEDEIQEMLFLPEFQSVDDFVELKMANDDVSFTTAELQALARVKAAIKSHMSPEDITVAPVDVLKNVKDSLVSYGLSFKPREPVKFVREGRSSAHGSSPFAGSGGGGSGFGSDLGGPTFTSFGGGPGAIGGGYKWDPNDKKNLPMGAKRKK